VWVKPRTGACKQGVQHLVLESFGRRSGFLKVKISPHHIARAPPTYCFASQTLHRIFYFHDHVASLDELASNVLAYASEHKRGNKTPLCVRVMAYPGGAQEAALSGGGLLTATMHPKPYPVIVSSFHATLCLPRA
jgi:hypothetical protein